MFVRAAGNQRGYPWKEWFKGSKPSFVLTRGEHFNCQSHSMGVQVRNAGAKLGYKVCIYINGDELEVWAEKEKKGDE